MSDCIRFILENSFTETVQQTVLSNDTINVKLLLNFVQKGYLISIPSFKKINPACLDFSVYDEVGLYELVFASGPLSLFIG
jgi:hypothetical protein